MLGTSAPHNCGSVSGSTFYNQERWRRARKLPSSREVVSTLQAVVLPCWSWWFAALGSSTVLRSTLMPYLPRLAGAQQLLVSNLDLNVLPPPPPPPMLIFGSTGSFQPALDPTTTSKLSVVGSARCGQPEVRPAVQGAFLARSAPQKKSMVPLHDYILKDVGSPIWLSCTAPYFLDDCVFGLCRLCFTQSSCDVFIILALSREQSIASLESRGLYSQQFLLQSHLVSIPLVPLFFLQE